MPLLLRLANKLVAGVQEKWEAGGMVMPRMWAVMFSEGMVEVRKKLTEAIGAEPVPDAPPKTCFVQIGAAGARAPRPPHSRRRRLMMHPTLWLRCSIDGPLLSHGRR